MAKNKSFDFGSLMPQVEKAAPKTQASVPTPVTEKKTEKESTPLVPAATTSAPQVPVETSHNDLLVLQPKKKSNKKMVSFKFNEDEYNEFQRINKSLDYSNNEVMARLMNMYIKANQK